MGIAELHDAIAVERRRQVSRHKLNSPHLQAGHSHEGTVKQDTPADRHNCRAQQLAQPKVAGTPVRTEDMPEHQHADQQQA